MRRVGLTLLMLVALPPLARTGTPPPFLHSWGTYGTAQGQFNEPWCLAITPSGSVLVVDSGNHRIQEFTSQGDFVQTWGTQGSAPGQFLFPRGIAVDADGNLYIADTFNYRIQKFTGQGTFLAEWGSEGDGPGDFRLPWSIAIDDEGYVYVAEAGGHRVQKFTEDGVFVTTWGTGGTGDGDFVTPRGIAAGSSGTIYVAERSSLGSNGRVQKFTREGAFTGKWSVAWPSRIVVDSQERCYVTRTDVGIVVAYDSGGGSLWELGGFNSPEGVAVDADQSVYVCDTYNHRIAKYGDVATSVRPGTWGRLKRLYR
jgi:tripartite motif-containing protein 71